MRMGEHNPDRVKGDGEEMVCEEGRRWCDAKIDSVGEYISEDEQDRYERGEQRNRAIDTFAATLEVFETSRPEDLELLALKGLISFHLGSFHLGIKTTGLTICTKQVI